MKYQNIAALFVNRKKNISSIYLHITSIYLHIFHVYIYIHISNTKGLFIIDILFYKMKRIVY